ncbi:TPA: bacterial Ig-like domain-containing protein [Listeria innocua]|nr:bacterial Ig-like domain-containing protein [Listeria innocua]HBM3685582.1 bacterial Ig-like domain-containing protein [Listeria innocua]
MKKKSIASLLISGIIFSQLAPIVSFAVEQEANEKPTELTQLEETPNSTDEKTNEELNQTEIEEQEIQDEKSQDTKSNTSKEQSQTQESSKESNETTNTQSEISAEQATKENSDVEKDVNPEIIKGSWGTAPYEYNQDTGELKVGGGDLSNWFNTTGFLISKADDAEVKKIVFTEPVNAPSNSMQLFWGTSLSSVEEICGLFYLDTSKVTNMKSMFANMNRLKSIDVSNFDTKNVTTMAYMFFELSGIESIDVSNFDTKNVIDMANMFYKMTNLKSLDVSNFDTKKVGSMQLMFYSMTSLTSLDISSFETNSSTNMDSMFNGANNLSHINLGKKIKFSRGIKSQLVGAPSSAPYNGRWLNTRSRTQYSASDIMTKYNGLDMYGYYHWVKANSIEAIDSTIYTGNDWKAEDNFLSAMDKEFNLIDFPLVTVTGSVDTTTPGEYEITYSVNGLTTTITVTVKENQASVVAENSTIYTKESWKAEDNFVSATNKKGKIADISSVTVTGEVDVNTPGDYEIMYTIDGVSTKIIVTVKEDKSSIEAKDSALYVGDTWNSKDNFISATDKEGNPVDFKDIKVEGTVNTTKPGTNKVTYLYGNQSKEVTITVKADQSTLEVKDSIIYTGDKWNPKDNFITATDKDGNPVDFKDIKVEGTVDTTKPGTNKITYIYGNLSKEVTVTVKANQATLEAKDSALYVGDTWNAKDNFISATDKDGNPVDFKDIKVEGTVDTTKAGTNKVTYLYGNQSKEVTVTVKADQTTLEAKDSVIYTGDKWKAEDNFISATDKTGNSVDFKDIKVEGTVDTTKAGTNKVTYTYANQSKEVTITVKADQATLEAKDSIIYTGDKWKAEDNFISATDKAGKTIDFKKIKVEGTVDTTKAGDYDITYSYSGVTRSTELSKTITVTVKKNQANLEAKDSTLYEGDKWIATDNFVSATDKDGNPVDFKAIEVKGTVNTTKAGTYKITYSYAGVSKTITVTVLANQTKIVAKDLTIYEGDNWKGQDNFVSATDKFGQAIDFNSVKVTGSVDIQTPGKYRITYSIEGASTTITVTVLADQSDLVAKNSTIYVGDKWQSKDNFVSATDKYGKPIDLSLLTVTGTVDTTTPGEYEITYSVNGLSTTITVTVKENQANIVAEDSTIHAKESWKAEDNFVSATDKTGKNVDLSSVSVIGKVDINTPGNYEITYTIDGVSTTITVTVLVNHSQIEAHDAKIKVGTSWKPEDSFILAKDKFGETADFSDVTVEGTVDTTKPGKYQITYTIDGVSVTITVIVEDNSKGSSNTITTPPTNHSIGEEETSNSTDKQLPKTGEQQNNFFLLGGLVLVALAFILGKRKMYK